MTKSEIEAKIASLKKSIDSKFTPENFKGKMRDSLAKYEGELKNFKEEPAKKPEAAPASAAKRGRGRPAGAKAKAKEKPKRSIVVDGKTITQGEADFCKKVVEKWYERRTAVKQSKAKSDAKSPAAKAAGQISDAVGNIIESTSVTTAQNKPAQAGESIVEKILKLMEKELSKRAKDDPKKKEAVQKAIGIIRQLLKEL